MTLIIVLELSFYKVFGLKIKVGFCAYSVCAEATFACSQNAQKPLTAAHAKYAQKLLLRSLSMRQSLWGKRQGGCISLHSTLSVRISGFCAI